MDTDLIIGIAHALAIAGAIVLLIGLLAIVRPVAAIGLRIAHAPAWRRSLDFAWLIAGSRC
jgi:hypothetical protein